MFYDASTLAALNGKIESLPAVREGWERFAARMRTLDEEAIAAYERRLATLRERARELGGNKRFTLGNFARELSREAHRLAFYFRMTSEPRAADGARRLLLSICEEEAWLYQVGGGRKSDLWTADMGVNASLAFDALRSVLSEAERESISACLREKAFMPLYDDWLHPVKRIHALDTMGHNWWSVCAAGAGVVLLAIGDDREESDAYLHAVVEGLKEWFAYPGNVLQNKKGNFGAGGDYIETMSYLDYALSNVVVFESFYRRRTGDDGLLRGVPALEGVPDAYIATVYRSEDGMKTLGFGDVGDRDGCTFVWLRLGELLRRGEMLAFFHAFKPAPDGPLELLYYPSDLPSQPFPAGDRTSVLEHSGYAVLRSVREGRETVFAIKTGESWNHNHLDVGTFQLISGGKEFIVDSGYCVYSKPLYNSYYRQSRAHNVVLLDGEGQPPEMIEFGTKFEGSIPVALESPGYRYVLADCTGPYMHLYHRFYRHVIFADRFFVLVDDLHANRDGAFEWLLHYDGTMSRDGDTVRIANGGETLELRQLYPDRKTYATEQGYLSSFHRSSGKEDEFPEAEYLSVRVAGAADRRIKFINLFMLPGEDGARFDVEKFGDERVHAFRVREPEGGATSFYCNTLADGRVMHENSHIAFERIETDAFLATIAVDEAGRLQRVSLHNGSYVKVDGVCLFSSLLKCDATLDYRDGLEVRTFATAAAWCYVRCDGEATADDVRYDPNVGMYKKRVEAGVSRFRL